MSESQWEVRLLQVMLAPGDGGAETFFEKLVIAFQEAGISQRVVICQHPERKARLVKAGCDVVEIAAQGWQKWLAKARVKAIAKTFQPNVQMAWMSRAAGALSKLPDCVNIARLGGYYPLKYYQTCDLLIGNTPGVLEYLKGKGWPEEKMLLLSNFGEVPDADSTDMVDWRAKYGISTDVPVLVTLGRLHENKAQDILIKAMELIPRAHLLLAGEGSLRKELEQLSTDCGVRERVHFLGWCRDTAGLFSAADICVFPSRAEPLGNVVLESWAHGMPIAAAESEGPSWLIDHEQNGLLFPVDDVKACAGAANRFLEDADLAAHCVAGGRQKWQDEFSKDAIVSQYRKLFSKLLS